MESVGLSPDDPPIKVFPKGTSLPSFPGLTHGEIPQYYKKMMQAAKANFFRTLECANMKYSEAITREVIALAKRIDN